MYVQQRPMAWCYDDLRDYEVLRELYCLILVVARLRTVAAMIEHTA